MNPPDRMTCEDVFRRLDDYLDRELATDELTAVERHLAECAACTDEYRFEASLLEELRRKVGRMQVPPRLLTAIRARLDESDT
jgi:anti-sigma factor (TIGR02949 family)